MASSIHSLEGPGFLESAEAGEKRRRLTFEQREALLLQAALTLLRRDGYHQFTMNRIAEGADCSRKTVYNHFANTDDVVMALAVQSTTRRADLMARAATFRGRPRERFGALSEIARVYTPIHMQHELALFVSDVPKRTSPERQRLLQSQEERIISISAGIIRDAQSAGDLSLPDGLTPEQLVLACHIIGFGGHAVSQRGFGVGSFDTDQLTRMMYKTGNLLLDDLDWKPLSHEVDWENRMQTMWDELFPDLDLEAELGQPS